MNNPQTTTNWPAYRTGQAESEVNDVTHGRRSVGRYDVRVRIADGLRIPRGQMGLAYDLEYGEATEPAAVEAEQS